MLSHFFILNFLNCKRIFLEMMQIEYDKSSKKFKYCGNKYIKNLQFQKILTFKIANDILKVNE